MKSKKPSPQICPVCGDDEVDTEFVDDVWTMICDDGCHPMFEWKPTVKAPSLTTHRSGLGEELGVYETLLECVAAGAAEYGVVEYRFAERDRPSYDFLVARYGHKALEPSKYTASSFLGGALGQLWREKLVAGRMVTATGYWSYNGEIGGYASPEADAAADILSWTRFAAESLGVDPDTWPPLVP